MNKRNFLHGLSSQMPREICHFYDETADLAIIFGEYYETTKNANMIINWVQWQCYLNSTWLEINKKHPKWEALQLN